MIYYDYYLSPIGKLIIASDGQNITGLWIEGQKHFALPQDRILCSNILPIRQTQAWLERYFRGENPSIDHISLRPQGTPFQERIWQFLRDIPYGDTITYGQIATALGMQTISAQAVGNAVGRNPIMILIPCHRVVGKHSLTGYAGGIQRKIQLLQLEKSL